MSRSLAVGAAFGHLAFALPLAAQCANVALPSDGLPGANGAVHASLMWDPDGAGPATPRLVIGGEFSLAGTTLANNVAAWDPATGAWTALGSGVTGAVHALTALSNGDLVVAGTFTSAGGGAASRIARWNGTAWVPLGTGLGANPSDIVHSLATLPGGDVVAGGFFTQAGGLAANSIARWNGAAWAPLGAGVNGGVLGLQVIPNGDLIASGSFDTAGGIAANRIARWNGAAWSPLGGGLGTGSSGFARALTLLPNGDVVAAGSFSIGISRWNGSTWTPFGTGALGEVSALVTMPNGDVVAGGVLLTISAWRNIARWNGSAWSAVGTLTTAAPNDGITTLTVAPSGDLFAGGSFSSLAGVGARNLARWNGIAWEPVGNGISDTVAATLTMPNGDLIVGGSFVSIGGTVANRIARWNGATWSPLGTGFNGSVFALTRLPNGDIVAGGTFSDGGLSPETNVARWNGASWVPLGSGLQSSQTTLPGVSALVTMPNGDVIAAGAFQASGGNPLRHVARWNGSTWTPLGTGIPSGNLVRAAQVMPNGDLVVAGLFSSAGGVVAHNIARWNGTVWSALGSGLDWQVFALHVRPNGDLVAGGAFANAGGVPANRIARWDGAAWSALGSGADSYVLALATHPNGDLFAGGVFGSAGGAAASRLASWNGASWSAVGSGLDSDVYSLSVMPNGELAAGGDFRVALGAVSPNLARIATTCPATANSYGAGCSSSAGPVSLASTSLPWLGGTYRATTAGMPVSSLALDVFGFAQVNIGLPSILPQGVAGCSLLASPDLLGVLVPVAGTVQSQLGIPNAASLVNQLIHHQVAALELGPAGITAITSSNGLTLTLGSF